MKSCATCRWFDPTMFGTQGPPYEEDDIAACEWPAERLPYSLRWGNRERVAVRPTDGADCSCYELKKLAAPVEASGERISRA